MAEQATNNMAAQHGGMSDAEEYAQLRAKLRAGALSPEEFRRYYELAREIVSIQLSSRSSGRHGNVL